MYEIMHAALAAARGVVSGAIGIGHAKSKGQSVLIHHATHGDLLPHKGANRIVGQLIGVLTLNTDLDTYRKGGNGKTGHLGHHGRRFATREDEESQFMLQAGYYPGMSHRQLWVPPREAAVFAPVAPEAGPVSPADQPDGLDRAWRRAVAIGFWGSALGLAAATDMLVPMMLGWLLPLFVVGQAASWSEAVSRHRWLVTTQNPKRPARRAEPRSLPRCDATGRRQRCRRLAALLAEDGGGTDRPAARGPRRSASPLRTTISASITPWSPAWSDWTEQRAGALGPALADASARIRCLRHAV